MSFDEWKRTLNFELITQDDRGPYSACLDDVPPEFNLEYEYQTRAVPAKLAATILKSLNKTRKSIKLQ